MSKLEKYPKYKESGVEWLGEIPEGWEIKKLKFLIKEHSGNGFPIAEQDNKQGIIPFYKVSDINGDTDYLYSANNYVTVDLVKKMKWNLVPINSIIAAKIGEALRKNHRKITTKESVIDNNCIAIQPLLIDVKYSFYLHRIIDFDWFSNPGAVPSISVFKYKNFYVMLPPSEEQTKIANYLDQKTAQTDKAISLKEQMIERLKERRHILINDAVTKGLDKTVKMKDSGIEWIGEIPEEWEVLPGFQVYKENKTKNIGMIEDQVLSLSYGKIIIKAKEKLTGLVPESFETYQIVKPGDIIIRCMDLQNDQTSLRTGIARNDGIITSAYLNLNVIDHFNSEYLHYYLHMLDITKVLYKFGTGLRQNLSYWDFKRLPVLVPSIKEQEEIVKFIETQTRKIDTTILLQQNQIERLKEYKATLIDSLVTGKVKVMS